MTSHTSYLGAVIDAGVDAGTGAGVAAGFRASEVRRSSSGVGSSAGAGLSDVTVAGDRRSSRWFLTAKLTMHSMHTRTKEQLENLKEEPTTCTVMMHGTQWEHCLQSQPLKGGKNHFQELTLKKLTGPGSFKR